MNDVQNILQDDDSNYTIIKEKKLNEYRWTDRIMVVFTVSDEPGKLYAFEYLKGLTEDQDSEVETLDGIQVLFYGTNTDKNIPVYEVVKYEKTVYDYKKKED